jgi:hypothetical protein
MVAGSPRSALINRARGLYIGTGGRVGRARERADDRDGLVAGRPGAALTRTAAPRCACARVDTRTDLADACPDVRESTEPTLLPLRMEGARPEHMVAVGTVAPAVTASRFATVG